MKNKFMKKVTTLAAVSALTVSSFPTSVFAQGEVDVSTSTFKTDTDNSAAFQTWKDNVWVTEKADSGKIALTPGATAKDLNFAWYSQSQGTPAVKIWKEGKEAEAVIVKGTATAISAENWQGSTYAASNKVTVSNYFEENSTYKYQYTDNYVEGGTVTWSQAYDYKTSSTSSFSVILTGDPQVGASGSSSDYSADDASAARDTYNWNLTMQQAVETDPDAAFLLSAGDQIDKSGATKADDKKTRESEYAGYLYSDVFRSLPIASTIGNHDMAGVDYSQHFNNPNSEDNLGATAAGSDYYFSYGDVLFISLNSNNRNQEEHRALMEKAVASNEDAVWKVVIFHSDIYGSGQPHADTDAATNRIIFAPLMDEFDIDVCLTGHDHTYSRSYQILDGNVIDYDISNGSVTDPEGTLYITTGSGSGSKYYNLLNYTPYYIAERTNECLPAFSTIDFTDNSLTIKTYNYNGGKYAEDFTINKTSDALSLDETIEKAETTLANLDTAKYTDASVTALRNAIANIKELRDKYTTPEDQAVSIISTSYNTEGDPIVGYGSVKNNEDKDEVSEGQYANRLRQGYSTLLDKTIYTQLNDSELKAGSYVASAEIVAAKQSVEDAIASLELVNVTLEGESQDQNQSSQQTVEKDTTDKADKTDKTDKTESVQTGDKSAGIIGGSIAAMISALGCIVIAARKREEKCETK